MTNRITDDPDELKDYQDELEYHEETHPVQQTEPSKLKKFLIKANNVSVDIGDKIKNAVQSPTAHKIDEFLRDMAEKSNNSDSGSGFDIRSLGGNFGHDGFGFGGGREDRGVPRETQGCTVTKTIRPNGEIVITTHAPVQQHRQKKQRGEMLGNRQIGGNLMGRDDDHL
jgi:hypothetical protein